MLTTDDILKVFQELNLCLDELTEKNYEYKLIDELYEAVDREILPIFECFTGASKVVLHFEGTDFVIKIPFNGTEEACYEDDGEFYDEYEFVPFSGAGEYWDDNCWDYCSIEVERFQAALDEKVDECFLETKYVGSVNNYPIYAQKFAEIYCYGDRDYEHSNKADDLNKTSSICSSHHVKCFHTNWLTDVRKYYGEEFLLKLLCFIKDYEIRDLHSENFGYINGRPIIIDYASFDG